MSASDVEAFDPEALARLVRFGGIELLRGMVDAFTVNAAERRGQLRVALASGDAPLARLMLHSLKSSAAQLGVPRLARMSARGEELASRGAMDELAPLIAALESELDAALRWLAARRNAAL